MRCRRRAQLGAATPGCACMRNPLRLIWPALAPQAVFPNDNINCSGRVRMADLTLARLAFYLFHACRARASKPRPVRGAGVLRCRRRPQPGAATPGCACMRNPFRFAWPALAPQAIFPNDNVDGSSRALRADPPLTRDSPARSVLNSQLHKLTFMQHSGKMDKWTNDIVAEMYN